MKEFIGEGGRGLGLGFDFNGKVAREKLKIKSDYLFPILNPIRAPVQKNNLNPIRASVNKSYPSQLNKGTIMSTHSENQETWLDDLIGEAPPQIAQRLGRLAQSYSAPKGTADISPQKAPTKYDEELDKKLLKNFRHTIQSKLTIGDPDSAALKILRREAEKRAKKVAKTRKPLTSAPKLPPSKTSRPKEVPLPYTLDESSDPRPRTPDNRSPDPLAALKDGQKLIEKANDNLQGNAGILNEPAIRSLDVRERTFVGHLFNGLPADEAADLAGYPHRDGLAQVIFNKPHIRTALEWLQKEYLRSIGATLTNVVTQMTHIAFLDPRRVVDMETGAPIPLHKLDFATAAALESVDITQTEFNGASTITKTKYKFNSKLKAIQQLGEHLGLFNQVQKVELTGKDGGPIEMEMSHTEIARRIAFMLRSSPEIVDVDITPAEG